jgi:hypothetical protein
VCSDAVYFGVQSPHCVGKAMEGSLVASKQQQLRAGSHTETLDTCIQHPCSGRQCHDATQRRMFLPTAAATYMCRDDESLLAAQQQDHGVG